MRIVGLTGGIGMGKSTAARMLRRRHIPIFDADAEVHRLQAPGGKALPALAQAFPGVVVEGRLDRVALGRLVFGNPPALRRLEAIIHPLTAAALLDFLKRNRRQRRALVVLDVPLLFEGRGWRLCDTVWTVSARPGLQRQRVLNRPGASEAVFARMLRDQLADADRRRLAGRVIPSLGYAAMARALAAALIAEQTGSSSRPDHRRDAAWRLGRRLAARRAGRLPSAAS